MESTKEIETTLNNLFTEIMLDLIRERSSDIDQFNRFIPSLVSTKKNDLLMKHITLCEVEEAMFQMRERTTLCLDGFTVNFFHRYRDLIKMEV